MAGIHGRENDGSYSIVLSGGYEDDEDEGEEFTYSGSGGRDLSGNKRTAKQSYDQKLTHMNKYVPTERGWRLYVWGGNTELRELPRSSGLWLRTAVLPLMIRMEPRPRIGRRGSQFEW